MVQGQLELPVANINTKTYVDVHTTGQRREFSSIKQYDKFLKEHKSHVVSKSELEKMSRPENLKNKVPGYPKELLETAWKEREKFKMDIKYGRRKLEYDV